MFILSVFEWLSSQWDKGNPHEQFASVAIISTLILGAIAWGGHRFAHWRYKRNLFSIRYPDSWPAPPNIAYPRQKTVHQGTSDVLIAVILGSVHEIQDFDVRFVQTNKGGNVSGDIIKVMKVHDLYMNLPFPRPDQQMVSDQVLLWGIPNAANGIDCHYVHPVRIHQGRALFLRLTIVAARPWEGYIGFRSLDKDNCPVKPKADFTVIPAPSVDKEGPKV